MRSKLLLSLEPIPSLSKDETQIPASCALLTDIGVRAAVGQQAHLSNREHIRAGIGRILGSNNANLLEKP